MKRIGFLAIILVFGLVNKGFSQDVTNRQILEKLEKMEMKLEELDTKIDSLDVRVAKLEARIEEGQKSLQKQIDALDKRIDGLQGIVVGGFGIIFLGIFTLIGFVLWDRKTALSPAIKKIEALEEREGRLESALREFAKREPKFAEAFRYAGLL